MLKQPSNFISLDKAKPGHANMQFWISVTFCLCLCTGETVEHSSLPCYVGTQAGNHQLKNHWESGWGKETPHDLVLEARGLVQWIPTSPSSQVALFILLETELNAFGQHHQWSQVKDA